MTVCNDSRLIMRLPDYHSSTVRGHTPQAVLATSYVCEFKQNPGTMCTVTVAFTIVAVIVMWTTQAAHVVHRDETVAAGMVGIGRSSLGLVRRMGNLTYAGRSYRQSAPFTSCRLVDDVLFRPQEYATVFVSLVWDKRFSKKSKSTSRCRCPFSSAIFCHADMLRARLVELSEADYRRHCSIFRQQLTYQVKKRLDVRKSTRICVLLSAAVKIDMHAAGSRSLTGPQRLPVAKVINFVSADEKRKGAVTAANRYMNKLHRNKRQPTTWSEVFSKNPGRQPNFFWGSGRRIETVFVRFNSTFYDQHV